MKFDLRTHESALKFLSEFTLIDESDIFLYLLDKHFKVESQNFIEHFKVDFDKLNVHKITFVISHVTSCNDKLKSIMELGLLNLQEVIKNETPLSIFLKENDIFIDVDNKLMKYKETVYDISYHSENNFRRDSHQAKLNSIGRKLYFDHQLNGFLQMKTDKSYAGRVHERPEILFNLSSALSIDLEGLWESNKQSFVIEFETMFEDLEYFTFYLNKNKYIDDIGKYTYLKCELINLALVRTCKTLINDYDTEIYAYLKPEVVIQQDKILSFRVIN